ncbi:MAG: NAD(P)/FAD-dependent oxidoreductase [Thermoanaerobaculum sp.]|nr:NAD(P)/FAD-dependent oxidoreductase [Thermoanaerobaculum sp.]MDW7968538.1 NAD(P)/FAD-dependent oxidoreductase [Thermoanaerobaculum sp.]
MRNEDPNTVAVVGAGLTGLVAAWRLVHQGWRVEVFERYPQAGGLVATFRVGGEELECFYHHLFTTDREYVALAQELGLAEHIRWLPSTMGIFSAGKLFPFGTPASLLRFSPFSPLDKLRFALSVLYLTRVRKPDRFSGVTAWEWIRRYAGRRVLELVWGPLLAQKFAERQGDVSMAWLWKKVQLRGQSRGAGGLREALGYMDGSFGRLVRTLAARLQERGVTFHLAQPVLTLRPTEAGLELRTRQGLRHFSRVLFTASPRELLQVARDSLPQGYQQQLARLEAAHALCLVLELDRPFLPFYWTNVADDSFPFGGVIEHTNLVAAERYGGCHVVYLSKYLFANHPLWQASKREVFETFLPHLPRLNPGFSPDWILAWHLFKAADAQPLVTCHYERQLPPMVTPIRGLYHCSMAHIYPEDRGQNYAVREANRVAALISQQRPEPARGR